MTKPKQTIRRFFIEEMGFLVASESLPHSVSLSSLFLTKHLGVTRFDNTSSTTNVGCPFCKEGRLRLINVDPTVSHGHHVGNGYSYDCSNGSCDGTFSGSYRWMYID